MSADCGRDSSVGDPGEQMVEVGEQQGDPGEQRGEFGEQQGEFGEQRGEFGEQQGEFGEQEGEESDSDMEPVVLWVPSGRRLLSGLLGLNVVLLGAALVASQAFNPTGLRNQEPQAFLLLVMGLSLIWMLWYLLWARAQPGLSPHIDHHAGSIAVTVVLMVLAGFSVLLHIFRMWYNAMMVGCKPATKILAPIIEGPFLALQTYLLWAHSKDCIQKHKIQTRSGLILTLCADVLLWLNAVTEDTVHMEIELEREIAGVHEDETYDTESFEPGNGTLCQCGAYVLCLVFRKGFEVLYPFNMEYYLMASCLLYVMWKNVGRRTDPRHPEPPARRFTLRMVRRSGVRVGPLAGGVVLLVGVVLFVLYQVWVGQREQRRAAFLLFYGYHLVLVPLMVLASLAGTLVQALERRGQGRRKGGWEPGHNPARSLDVLLLLGAALGQLALSYFSLVAALAVGPQGMMGNLDLAYSLLSLLELILQNVFIIDGLNGHHGIGSAHSSTPSTKKKNFSKAVEELPGGLTLLEPDKAARAPSVDGTESGRKPWTRRVKKEICAFLILSNIMLWVIPAFGAHPQFENGLGKQFFGFTAWFILVNLGQPLGVFYRMHSVGALMELLLTA
ncbi:proton channel OTOP3-like isoform X1 [Anguilla anguilla]|uniref:proton channel OTOP3-like isoform X1 n=1 Tax=Anguilla anguilla TaxID=7936 RepID=UPI0015ABAC1C|nr:proton channel OTOP3-like isoform X1 [Anguilla anguilla]